MRKIGLFFGSFNPIHEGHMYCVKKALKYVDNVIIIPAYRNPFKLDCTNLDLRIKMINNDLQTLGLQNKVSVMDIENLLVNELNYTPTYKVLELFNNSKNVKYYWILTEETYLELPSWCHYDYLNKYPKILLSRKEYMNDSSIIDTIKDINDITIHSSNIREKIKEKNSNIPGISDNNYKIIKQYKLYE